MKHATNRLDSIKEVCERIGADRPRQRDPHWVPLSSGQPEDLVTPEERFEYMMAHPDDYTVDEIVEAWNPTLSESANDKQRLQEETYAKLEAMGASETDLAYAWDAIEDGRTELDFND